MRSVMLKSNSLARNLLGDELVGGTAGVSQPDQALGLRRPGGHGGKVLTPPTQGLLTLRLATSSLTTRKKQSVASPFPRSGGHTIGSSTVQLRQRELRVRVRRDVGLADVPLRRGESPSG